MTLLPLPGTDKALPQQHTEYAGSVLRCWAGSALESLPAGPGSSGWPEQDYIKAGTSLEYLTPLLPHAEEDAETLSVRAMNYPGT